MAYKRPFIVRRGYITDLSPAKRQYLIDATKFVWLSTQAQKQREQAV